MLALRRFAFSKSYVGVDRTPSRFGGRFRRRRRSSRRAFGMLITHCGTSQPLSRITFAIERSSVTSSSVKNVIADPVRPARPVRPTR
jgi:hypothetical protein